MTQYYEVYFKDQLLSTEQSDAYARKVIADWIDDCETGSEGTNFDNYSIMVITE